MVIAVDFDGTLCEINWPGIGEPKTEVIDRLKSMRKNGCRLILWTCRAGQALEDAVSWCRDFGLEFDAVNENLPDNVARFNNNSRKVMADLYLDDSCLTPEDFLKKEGLGG